MLIARCCRDMLRLLPSAEALCCHERLLCAARDAQRAIVAAVMPRCYAADYYARS